MVSIGKAFLVLLVLVFNTSVQAQTNPPTAESASLFDSMKKSVHFGLAPNGKISFKNGKADFGSGDFKVTHDYSLNNGFVLGLGLGQMIPQAWNNGVRIEILHVNIAGDKAIIDNVDISGNSESLSLITLGYSGNYRFKDFYLPIGVAYSALSTSASSNTIIGEAKSSLTYWFGAGYVVNESWSLELVDKKTSLYASKISVADIEMGTADFHRLELSGIFSF